MAEQLKVGLAENRQIDLRDAKHEVVVAFEDEPILPVWANFALNDAAHAHLFIAPTDFESGRLTMISLIDGSRELHASDQFIQGSVTFGELVDELRNGDPSGSTRRERRFQVISAPASVYHDGLAYSFSFTELVDV